MRQARRRAGGAAGAFARALLFLALLISSPRAVAIRVVELRGSVANRSHAQRNNSGRVAVSPRKAVPMVGTGPVPARMPPEEESKRRIPTCPDPLHNR
jgi:hypothetical protein